MTIIKLACDVSGAGIRNGSRNKNNKIEELAKKNILIENVMFKAGNHYFVLIMFMIFFYSKPLF